jgi:hypothetical protein
VFDMAEGQCRVAIHLGAVHRALTGSGTYNQRPVHEQVLGNR